MTFTILPVNKYFLEISISTEFFVLSKDERSTVDGSQLTSGTGTGTPVLRSWSVFGRLRVPYFFSPAVKNESIRSFTAVQCCRAVASQIHPFWL